MHLDKSNGLNSLSIKVLLSFVIGVVLSITLITLVIFWLSTYHKSFLATLDVTDAAEDMATKLKFDSAGKPIGFDLSKDEFGEFNWVFDSMKQEVAYRVLDKTGHTILGSVTADKFWPSDKNNAQPLPGHFLLQHNGVSFHNVIVDVPHGNENWYFQLAVNERFYELVHNAFALPFTLTGIVVFSFVLFAVFGFFAFITLRCTLKPLRDLSESAAAISPRFISARLSLKGVPSEIRPLVESFNRVLDRLEGGYRIQQDFMATAAHELKTPLALIRAQIEILEQCDGRDALLNDVAHMTRHVQQLLLLAEVSEDHNYKLSTVNTGDLVDEVVTYLQPMAQKANVLIKATHVSSANWQADSSALFVLIKNLLENAIQHAPEGSNVHIDIQDSKITVRDFGPGANQEQLEHMFERFWRGAHRRDHGAGLGLAICKEIAQAHEWRLSVFKAEPGLRFEIAR